MVAILLLLLATSISAATVPVGGGGNGGVTAAAVADTTVAAATSAALTCDQLPIPLSFSRDLYYVVLVGFSSFLLVGVVFFILASLEGGNKVVHVLSFLSTITLALGYFSMWEGFGAYYKTDEDSTCSLIFLGRFVTLAVTLPTVISSFILFCRVEYGSIIGGVGASVLAIFAWTLGSYLTGAQKYVWWTIGTCFAIALVTHLLAISTASKRTLSQHGSSIANVVFLVLTVVLFGYSIVWVIGQTGTGYLSKSTELALYVFLDAIAHIGVGFALISTSESILEEGLTPLLTQPDAASFHSVYGSGVVSQPGSSYTPAGFPGSYESRQYV